VKNVPSGRWLAEIDDATVLTSFAWEALHHAKAVVRWADEEIEGRQTTGTTKKL
jgi:hypothetical protein